MKPRMHRPFTALPQRQRGAVIVLIMIALLSILAMAALALDGGHMLVNKTRLQNAVDAAALSGAKRLLQVSGAVGAATVVERAARDTLLLNASALNGNGELASAITQAGGVNSFAVVELANSVYGPFTFPGPADASYVRVSVPNYPLSPFFWGILQVIAGPDPAKAVAAIATAGPSPTSPCDVVPLMVCGNPAQYDPANGMFWGYRFGDLQLLKTAANDDSPIGPGNFQLLSLDGNGGNVVRDSLAGGIERCNNVGEQVQTKPGNTVGPSVQGLNTRFGNYQGGNLSRQDYPPDLVITATDLKYDDKESPPRIEHQNQPVTSSNGNLSSASGALFDYNDWLQASAACAAGTGSGCQSGGVFERRMLKIVVGQCNGTDGGKTPIPVLGFGCFFVLQPAEHKGNEAQIFGQFVRECEGDNVAGPTPIDDAGPQIIQLYKTYIDNNRTPSNDS